VFSSKPGYLGVDTIDPVLQRQVSHHVSFQGGEAVRLLRSPHRYIWPAELDLMAQLAGFVLEHRDADWSATPFTAESTGHVSVYRLPGSREP
jgi:hypothetical protein